MAGGNALSNAVSSVAMEARRGWLAARALQIDVSAPYLTDRVHCRSHHARERFETVELAQRKRGQCRLNGLAQGLIVDRARESARESSRKLLERENVQSVLALTRGGQAPLAHRMATVGNHSVTAQAPPPPLHKFGRRNSKKCSDTP